MDPITIVLSLLALKTALGGKPAVSADPEVVKAQQQLADATALNTKIQQEVAVLKQQADQTKREMESANDARTKAEAANRAVETQKQRDEGLRVQAASAQDVADLKQQLAVAVGVAQSARNEKEQAQAALQKQLADATSLNTKIQQEVVVLQKQTEQAKQDLQTTVQRSGEERRNEKEAAFAEAQRQRDEGLRVQAESAKVVSNLQQQLALATQSVQQSGEERRDEKEAAFQRDVVAKAKAQQELAAATSLNTKIQQEVASLQQQLIVANQSLKGSGEERRNEKEAAFAEAQRQRDEGLRVQAESAKVVVGLQQQLAMATQAVQQSGEERRDEKEAAFQREMALKAQYAAYELGIAHKAEVERDLQNQYDQQRAAYERRIYELQAAAASKTAPVTITKSVTSRDLNRN
jgi:uncharacterized protein (UPF0548 family)